MYDTIMSVKNAQHRPWFTPYTNSNPSKKVIIIGGGISGAATAHSLAHCGYNVSIYEKDSALACGASGNSQAVLYGNFTGNHTPIIALSLAGYDCSHNLITRLLQQNLNYQTCGLIQLVEPAEIRKFKLLCAQVSPDFCHLVTSDEINRLANVNVTCTAGAFFPKGLWFNPKALIDRLTQHPNIATHVNQNIVQIEYIDNEWHLYNDAEQSIACAPNLVLCNSYLINQFAATALLKLRTIRGQTTKMQGNLGLKSIICGAGYITPNAGEHFTIGATFKTNQTNTEMLDEEHQENITTVRQFMPQLESATSNISGGHAAVRSSTTDYMPLVGPVADYQKFTHAYAKLSQDANYKISTPCPYLPGLFINAAHGAKGMLTAPICGEIIANYIDNRDQALNPSVLQALHPNRLYLKQIIKQNV